MLSLFDASSKLFRKPSPLEAIHNEEVARRAAPPASLSSPELKTRDVFWLGNGRTYANGIVSDPQAGESVQCVYNGTYTAWLARQAGKMGFVFPPDPNVDVMYGTRMMQILVAALLRLVTIDRDDHGRLVIPPPPGCAPPEAEFCAFLDILLKGSCDERYIYVSPELDDVFYELGLPSFYDEPADAEAVFGQLVPDLELVPYHYPVRRYIHADDGTHPYDPRWRFAWCAASFVSLQTAHVLFTLHSQVIARIIADDEAGDEVLRRTVSPINFSASVAAIMQYGRAELETATGRQLRFQFAPPAGTQLFAGERFAEILAIRDAELDTDAYAATRAAALAMTEMVRTTRAPVLVLTEDSVVLAMQPFDAPSVIALLAAILEPHYDPTDNSYDCPLELTECLHTVFGMPLLPLFPDGNTTVLGRPLCLAPIPSQRYHLPGLDRNTRMTVSRATALAWLAGSFH